MKSLSSGLIVILGVFVFNTIASAATVSVIDDASVYYARRDTNYGTAESLFTGMYDGQPNSITFLKFGLPQLQTNEEFINATLKGYYYYDPNHVSNYNQVRDFYVTIDNWTENTITWNNKPAENGAAIATWDPNLTAPVQWLSWDILTAVENEADGFLSLVFRQRNMGYGVWGDTTEWFRSKEYAQGAYGFYIEYETRQSPVPIPSTFLLMGSGLIGLVGFRRKKQK